MTSILRWSGSKARLLPALIDQAPPSYNRYIEPFVGSGRLFFSLLPNQAILGDINKHVIDVYRGIQKNPLLVADLLESTPLTIEAYKKLRTLDPKYLSVCERAARLIFLMKACFNGVYRTNKSGFFNVPMGNKVYSLPTALDLQRASEALIHVELIAASYDQCIKLSSPGDWIYLDPPYHYSGRFRGEYGYTASFTETDFKALVSSAKVLAESGRFITLSYVDNAYLLDNLKHWKITRVPTKRTVAGNSAARQLIDELIISSY